MADGRQGDDNGRLTPERRRLLEASAPPASPVATVEAFHGAITLAPPIDGYSRRYTLCHSRNAAR